MLVFWFRRSNLLVGQPPNSKLQLVVINTAAKTVEIPGFEVFMKVKSIYKLVHNPPFYVRHLPV